jgi:4-amino-4-deoxy-L-arabinose transferase-like glycosyltransferase
MTNSAQTFSWEQFLHANYRWLVALGVIVNISAIFTTIMEPDGALYATIAKNIALTGDFVNLKLRGADWLDKPHFPFWITAVSFKIFGINTFAYKLPALIFWGLGAYYTYKLAEILNNETTAKLSVLIYLTAAHLVISNNDVRAEPYLTGMIVASCYHFYKVALTRRFIHLLAGCLFAAMAMMTKGPFVIIIIGSGLFLHWMLKGEWKEIFNARWLIAAVLILLFITPELYTLYAQFDAHPEKKVFDQTGVSGVRFFFWDSQFGRFFNSGPIKGKGDPFFYFHTVLWAFLPWSILLYAAIIWRLRYFRKAISSNIEYITLGTNVVTFLLFSLSRFQLPHYLNIIFPFFAILVAQYFESRRSGSSIRFITTTQVIICSLLAIAVILLTFFYQPPYLFFAVVFILLSIFLVYFLFREKSLQSIFARTFLTAALTFLFLNIFFYPSLLLYQSGSQAAFYANRNLPGKPIMLYKTISYSLDFYARAPTDHVDSLIDVNKQTPFTVFTRKEYLQDFVSAGHSIDTIKTFPHFHISQVTGKFINHATREQVLETYVLAEVK